MAVQTLARHRQRRRRGRRRHCRTPNQAAQRIRPPGGLCARQRRPLPVVRVAAAAAAVRAHLSLRSHRFPYGAHCKRRTAQAAPILSRFGGAPAAPRRSTGYVLVHPGPGLCRDLPVRLGAGQPDAPSRLLGRGAAAGCLCARTGPAGDWHRGRLAPTAPGRTAFCVRAPGWRPFS